MEHSPEIYYSPGACVVLGLAAEESVFSESSGNVSATCVRHFELAFTYLQSGDYEDGWREFEWRWGIAEFEAASFP